MNIFALNDLREQAEHAAEQGMSPTANPYPETQAAFKAWNEFYYARLQTLAVECVS